MANIDWAKLVTQGRAKAYGISWTEEEARAVFLLKIPADYVRQGILTLEAYEKAKGQLPVDTKTKEELMAEAQKEGIAVTPDATKESLNAVLKAKTSQSKPKPKAKVKKTIRKK